MRTTSRQTRKTEPTIDDMRYDIAELEAMNMNTSDIINILIDGFEGLENMNDIDIRDEWESLFSNKSSPKEATNIALAKYEHEQGK
jgi:hypothetical protein